MMKNKSYNNNGREEDDYGREGKKTKEEKTKEEDFCEVRFQTKYMVSKALGHGLYVPNVGPYSGKAHRGLPCLKTLLKFYCLILFFYVIIDRYHEKNENKIKVGVLKCSLFTEEDLCMIMLPPRTPQNFIKVSMKKF